MDMSSSREGFPRVHQVITSRSELKLMASLQGFGWGDQKRHKDLLGWGPICGAELSLTHRSPQAAREPPVPASSDYPVPELNLVVLSSL